MSRGDESVGTFGRDADGTPTRVCLLFEHAGNRQVLADWLRQEERFTVAVGHDALDDDVDCCLVDVGGLGVYGAALADWKAEQDPVFSPCLLTSERGEVALDESTEDLVDDLVEMPVGRTELGRRIRRLVMQREQSRELDEARRTLRAQNERLETFAARLAHDLRNPLGIANGYVDMARETGQPEHFDTVERALGRMQRLIDETLTLAKMGQTVLDREPVSLAVVANEAWSHLPTANATLTVAEDLEFRADESRLVTLFENLYRNAIEHAGDDVAVTVGTLPDGFYVADDGPGIPSGDREMVFEVGYTTDEEGTGFGLRIVQEIVEAHGWSVTVTDAAGGGARFEVTGCVLVGDGSPAGKRGEADTEDVAAGTEEAVTAAADAPADTDDDLVDDSARVDDDASVEGDAG